MTELNRMRVLHEYIVFEPSFPSRSIRKLHLSFSVLDALNPFSFVAAAINPQHLSVTVSLIVFV
jgi:hypothetical protein